MAKQCATALAPVQAHLSDFAATLKKGIYVGLSDIPRKATNPHCSAVLWLCRFWHGPIFANAIRSDGLVLGEI